MQDEPAPVLLLKNVGHHVRRAGRHAGLVDPHEVVGAEIGNAGFVERSHGA